MRSFHVHALAAALAAVGFGACDAGDPPGLDGDGARLQIDVAALTLPGLTDACWNLTVEDGLGAPVWRRDGVCADDFGDGAAAISYVGACDAGSGADNVIVIELAELYTGDPKAALDAGSWSNPCPIGGRTCTKAVPCRPNEDARVAFDIAVMRAANQGFFDVAVNFDDVFCSAKLDCERDGQPLELLFDPATGQRDTTAVLAFACTAGPGQDTVLHMDHVVVTCEDAGGTRIVLDPTAGPGNHYGATAPSPSPLVFQAATYVGDEAFPSSDPPLNKCYWNLAVGLSVPNASLPSCRLTARATATDGPLTDSGRIPAGQVWPYVAFDVPLTDENGALACGAHALDAGTEVATAYTSTAGDTQFCYFMDCQPVDGQGQPVAGPIMGDQCDGALVCEVAPAGDVEIEQILTDVTFTAAAGPTGAFDVALGTSVEACDAACPASPGVDCTVPVDVPAFTIRLDRSSAEQYNDLFWPVVGDVDGDGETEIVAHGTGDIRVLDGRTLAVESTLAVNGDRGDITTIANLDGDPELEIVTLVHNVNRMIVADYDPQGNGWVVNISAVGETAFSCNGNVGSGLGIGVADFDGDGRAEIFYGNEVWTYPADLSQGCTGCVTKLLDADDDAAAGDDHGCSITGGGRPQGMISVVADVLTAADCGGDAECDGPELIVGGEVYSLDVAATTPTMTLRRDVNAFGAGTGYADGFAAVADLDGDGDLDVVVHAPAPGGTLYAYDPAQSQVLRVWNLGGGSSHGYSPIAIADFWDEDLADDGDTTNGSAVNLPDIVISRTNLLHAVNVASTTPLWSLAAADASGSTSLAVFDFNGDGVRELAYRDSVDMRIMYGGPMAYAPPGVNAATRDYAKFACQSATMNEGPTIADVDDDGSAELLVICGDATAEVRVFESATTPWRPARPIWNQPIFDAGAVDDAGNVRPVAIARNAEVPAGSGRTPYNGANIQISPLDLVVAPDNTIAAIDAVVRDVFAFAATGACGQAATQQDVTFTVFNRGDAPLTGTLPVSFYLSNGALAAQRTLATVDALVTGSLPLLEGEHAVFRQRVVSGATDVTVVLNNSGGAVADAPNAPFDECDLSDNTSTPATCQVCDTSPCSLLMGVAEAPGGALRRYTCQVPEGASGDITCRTTEASGAYDTDGTLLLTPLCPP